MKVKRKSPIPSIKATLSGKEVKKLLKELDQMTDLYRYSDPSLETPALDEFIAQLEEAAGEYC